ncbi:holin [Pandoraea sputorum]|uniref:holin n=1 Tax=Pandoraea sputorum TaxID=93222 RepID=UPI001242FFF6|nr:holin [Pandoraea sputorum]VVE82582.1 holin [Pandoraea sputorum]
MAEPTSGAVAAAVAVVVKVLPGAIGSLIALRFIGEGLTRKQKAMSFAAGAAMSYYLSPLVVMYFAITDAGAQQAFGFLMGLFGLALAKEVFKEINDADLIGALKRRLSGGLEK